MYVCNVDEASAVTGNAYVEQVKEAVKDEDAQVLVLAAKIESEIAELETYEERQMFLEEIGLQESGVNRLIKAAYALLNLRTFLTAGSDEVVRQSAEVNNGIYTLATLLPFVMYIVMALLLHIGYNLGRTETEELKKELDSKLEEFASVNDTLEETFENREQIEISKFYEKLPKPVLIAIEEFLDDKIYYRMPDEEETEA